MTGQLIRKTHAGFITCLCFILLNVFTASAQYQTLYFNKRIPQSVLINPTYVPNYTYTFGIPLLSSYDVNLRSPFSIKTLNYTTNGDTGYLDLDYLLKKTRDKNVMSLDGNVQMISLGYNTGSTYFSLDYSNKFVFDFRYPKDLVTLLWKGNEEFIGKTAYLDHTGINFTVYNEISLGVTHLLPFNLTVGGRLKYIQGLANFNTEKSNIRLHTDTTTYWLNGTADLLLNMSGPYNLDTFYFNDPVNYFFTNYHNPGFGVDLGINYKLNREFNFSASVLDMGKIFWKNDVTNYSCYNSAFTFEGYTIDSMTNFDDFKNLDSLGQVFIDSLKGEFNLDTTNNRYRTGLYPKIYLSGEYNINDNNSVGLLYYHRFMYNSGQNTISALYAHTFGKTLTTTVSYSLNDFKYNIFGAGFDLKLGSFQIYALCDNVMAIFATSSATSAPINFGINFLIGKPRVVIRQYTPGHSYSKRELRELEKGQKINRKLDTDHDGVPDLTDRCPYDSGYVLADGCPDFDHDSTGDLFDNCRKTPGPRINGGCPEVSKKDNQLIGILADILEFRTGSYKFTSSANVYLDELVVLLKEQPTLMLRLEGHAYDMPTYKENLELSKERVNNLIKYLTDNGIPANRIKASWYGSDKPLFNIEDPGTPVKKNRIEMELYYK